MSHDEIEIKEKCGIFTEKHKKTSHTRDLSQQASTRLHYFVLTNVEVFDFGMFLLQTRAGRPPVPKLYNTSQGAL